MRREGGRPGDQSYDVCEKQRIGKNIPWYILLVMKRGRAGGTEIKGMKSARIYELEKTYVFVGYYFVASIALPT